MAGVPFRCFPTSFATRIDSELFRTLLLRRLRLPVLAPPHRRLPMRPSPRRPRPPSVCVRCVGGSGPERFCGGSGCGTHLPRGRGQGLDVLVRDLDLSQVPGVDGRRLEVVAEGLSLFGGARLSTLVSALQGDGTAQAQHSKPQEGRRRGRTPNWQEKGWSGGPWPTFARTKFGQTKFGQTKFGQYQVWPNQLFLARVTKISDLMF